MHVGARIGLAITGGLAAGVLTERLFYGDRRTEPWANVMIGGVSGGAAVANARALARNTLHPAIGMLGLTSASIGIGMVLADSLLPNQGVRELRAPGAPTPGPTPSPSPGPAPHAPDPGPAPEIGDPLRPDGDSPGSGGNGDGSTTPAPSPTPPAAGNGAAGGAKGGLANLFGG